MRNSVIVSYDQSLLAVTLTEAKSRLRILDRTDFDTDVTRLIKVSTQWLERRYGIAIIKQVRQQRQDHFQFRLPYQDLSILYPPIQSIDLVKYTKEDGTEGTLVLNTDFGVSGLMTPVAGAQDIMQASIYPITSWPAIKNIPEAVRITTTCGFGDASTFIPEPIRESILRLLVFMFENPMDEITDQRISEFEMNIESFMSSYETYNHVGDENRLLASRYNGAWYAHWI